MKLESEFKNVVERLQRIKEKIPPYAEQLKASGDLKNFEKRLAWDCLRIVCGTTEICDWYKKYDANDTHIETLAKKALKEVYQIK